MNRYNNSLLLVSSDRPLLDHQEPRIGGDCLPRRKYTKVWYCHDATPILWKMGCGLQNQFFPAIVNVTVHKALEVLLREWRKDRSNKVLIFTKSVKLLEMLDFHLQTRGKLISGASALIKMLRISDRLRVLEAGRKHQTT